MLNIFWQCQHISPFWKEVCDTIGDITREELDITPAYFLLHESSSTEEIQKITDAILGKCSQVMRTCPLES